MKDAGKTVGQLLSLFLRRRTKKLDCGSFRCVALAAITIEKRSNLGREGVVLIELEWEYLSVAMDRSKVEVHDEQYDRFLHRVSFVFEGRS